MTVERPDADRPDADRPDDEGPLGRPTPSMRAVASALAPLTAAEARRRGRRRQRRLTASALVVAVVLVAGVGVQHRQDDGELTTAGRPVGSVPGVGGTIGTTVGTTAAPSAPVEMTTTTPPPTVGDATSSTTSPTAAPGSSTTSAAPTSTSTTEVPSVSTTTSPAAPGPVSLTGNLDKFHSELLFATPLCPDQEHRQDGTLSFSDGTSWQFHTVFCATIDGQNVWHGAGGGTLTGPGGAVLTATWDHSTQLPTYGVPYTMWITSGTGAYAGVSGACEVSVKLIDGPFYRFDDPDVADPVACDLVGWPAPAPTSPPAP